MTSTDAEAAIARQNDAMMTAFAAADLPALAAIYTQDARLMLPNAPVMHGPDQITAAFGEMIGSGLAGLKLTTDEVTDAGETAIEIGTYALITQDGAVADQGSYMVQWRAVSGGWLNHRDMVCSSVAATPPR